MKMEMVVVMVGLVGCSHGPIFVGDNPDAEVDDAGAEDAAGGRDGGLEEVERDGGTAGRNGREDAGNRLEDAATAGAGGTGGTAAGAGGEPGMDGGADADLQDAGSDGGVEVDAGDAAPADAGPEAGPDAQVEEPQCRECVGEDQGDCPDGYWCFQSDFTGPLHYCSEVELVASAECSHDDLTSVPRSPHPATLYQCLPWGSCEQWRQDHGL